PSEAKQILRVPRNPSKRRCALPCQMTFAAPGRMPGAAGRIPALPRRHALRENRSFGFWIVVSDTSHRDPLRAEQSADDARPEPGPNDVSLEQDTLPQNPLSKIPPTPLP